MLFFIRARMSRSLTFGLVYTWSKAMGTDTDYQYVANPLNHRKADYGLMTYDRRMKFDPAVIKQINLLLV